MNQKEINTRVELYRCEWRYAWSYEKIVKLFINLVSVTAVAMYVKKSYDYI